MPDRRGPLCTLIIASLAVLGAAAPVWAACPAGLPAKPDLHLPVEKLIPVASQLADHMAKKTIEGRAANGVETRPLADVQLKPNIKYSFRVYTPLSAIPAHVQNAFVAARVSPTRAEIESAKQRQVNCLEMEMLLFMSATLAGRHPEGLVPPPVVLTIRYFAHEFLPPEEKEALFNKTIRDKGNEQLIAFSIIKSGKVTFDKLLEWSLNIYYLGQGSYGVTAASMNYFDKPTDRLSVAEAAYLAVLVQGPSNYHPVRRTDKAVERRNWVIDQMEARGFITEADARSAKAEPLNAKVK